MSQKTLYFPHYFTVCLFFLLVNTLITLYHLDFNPRLMERCCRLIFATSLDGSGLLSDVVVFYRYGNQRRSGRCDLVYPSLSRCASRSQTNGHPPSAVNAYNHAGAPLWAVWGANILEGIGEWKSDLFPRTMTGGGREGRKRRDGK